MSFRPMPAPVITRRREVDVRWPTGNKRYHWWEDDGGVHQARDRLHRSRTPDPILPSGSACVSPS
jgi:hypothetical protein